MEHYLDARSMIPLIVHVFWGWITGPWVVPIPFPAVQRALDAIVDSSEQLKSHTPLATKTTKTSASTWPKTVGKERKNETPAAAPTMGPQLFLSLLLVAGMPMMMTMIHLTSSPPL